MPRLMPLSSHTHTPIRFQRLKLLLQLMIKIIIYIDIAFSTGRQIFYIGGLLFYINSTETKACVTAADLIDSGENLHCFTLPLSSYYIKISVVSQCRIIVAVQYMNTQLFAFILLPTFSCCTAQWLGRCWHRLTRTELADWQQKYESTNTNTNLKLTQTAATPYTGCTLPTNSTLLAAPDVHNGRTAASSAAVSCPHWCARNATY